MDKASLMSWMDTSRQGALSDVICAARLLSAQASMMLDLVAREHTLLFPALAQAYARFQAADVQWQIVLAKESATLAPSEGAHAE